MISFENLIIAYPITIGDEEEVSSFVKNEIKYCIENHNDIGFSLDEILNIDKVNRVGPLVKGKFETVYITTNCDEIIDAEQIRALKRNIAILKSKYKINIKFQAGFTIEEAQSASRKVDKWVDEINNARVNGKELSPFEKYLYAYNIAVNFMYKSENDTDSPLDSRNINKVLNSDKIVCVGFTSILKCLCNKIGIDCEYESINLKTKADGSVTGHSILSVKMNDPKYNINGIFFADPTADAIHPMSKRTRLTSTLIPYNELDKYYSAYDIRLDKTFSDYGLVRRELYDKDLGLKERFIAGVKKEIINFLTKNLDYGKLYIEPILDKPEKNIEVTKTDIICNLNLYQLEGKLRNISDSKTYQEIIEKHLKDRLPFFQSSISYGFMGQGFNIYEMENIVKDTLNELKICEYDTISSFPKLLNYIDNKINSQKPINLKDKVIAAYNVELARTNNKELAKKNTSIKMIESLMAYSTNNVFNNQVEEMKKENKTDKEIILTFDYMFKKIINDYENSANISQN